MSNVDNRIVNMQFNNSQFEEGIKTSLKSLFNLNKSIDSLGNNGGVDNLGNGLDSLGAKFSVLETIAVGALLNIGAKLENVVAQLVSGLTTDQLVAGWDKYEQKVQSVASLVAAGLDQSVIDQSLEKLLWFSDATSYSFSSMTDAFAKFVNSGNDVDASIDAMMGLSLEMSMAGKSASETGHAYENLARAMSGGYMNLIHWRGFVSQNMFTHEFQQQILDTAVAMGTLTKRADDLYVTSEGNEFSGGSIESYLKDQWLTSEVMNATLGLYSGYAKEVQAFIDQTKAETGETLSATEAMALMDEMGLSVDEFGKKAFLSGQETKTFAEAIDATKDATSTAWHTIFESLIGGYGEVQRLWGEVEGYLNEIFAAPVVGIADVFKEFRKGGGYKYVQDSILNLFSSIKSIVDKARASISKFFDGLSVFNVAQFVGNFQRMTEEGGFVYELFESLGDVVSSFLELIFSLGDGISGLIGDPLKKLKGYIGDFLIYALNKVAAGLSKVTEFVNNFFGALNDNDSTYLSAFITGLNDLLLILETVADAILDIVGSVFPSLSSGMTGMVDGVSKAAGMIGNALTSLKEWLVDDGRIETFKNNFINAFTNIKNFVSPIIDSIKEKVSTFFSEHGDEILAFFDKLGDVVNTVVNYFKDLAEKYGPVIMDFFSKVWGTLVDTYERYKPQIDSMFDSIIGFFETKVEGIQNGDTGETILTAISSLLDSLAPVVAKVATLVTELVPSVTKLVDGGIDLLINFINHVSQFLNEIGSGEKVDLKNVLSIAEGVGAVVLIVKACQQLFGVSKKRTAPKLNLVEIFQPFKFITDQIKSITGTITAINNNIKEGLKVAAFLAMVKMIEDLADAVVEIGQMTWEDLAKGVTTVGLIVVAVNLTFKKVADNSKNLTKDGAKALLGMAAIVAAITLIVNSCEKLENVSWGSVFKATLITTAVLTELAAMVLVVSATSEGHNDKTVAKALSSAGIMAVGIGAAVLLMASAMEKIAAIPNDKNNATGTVTFLVTELGTMAVTLAAVSKKANAGAISASALVIMALGLAMIEVAAAMKIIAKIGDDSNHATDAFIAVGIFLAELGGTAVLLVALSKNASAAGIAASALVVSAIGGAMLELSVAAKLIAGIKDPNMAMLACVAIGGLLVEIGIVAAGLVRASQNASAASILAASVFLLAIAGCIDALIPLLTIVGGLAAVSIESAIAVVGTIAILIGEVMLLAMGLLKASQNANASSILAASVFLVAMSSALDMLGILITIMAVNFAGNTFSEVMAIIGPLAILIGTVGAVAAAILLFSQEANPASILAASVLMVAMSTVFLSMSEMMSVASTLDSTQMEGIEQIVMIMGITLAGLVGLSSLCDPATLLSLSVAITATGVAFLALGASMLMLDQVKPETLTAGMIAFAAALTLVTVAAVALTTTGAFVALDALALVLIGLAAAVLSFGLTAQMISSAIETFVNTMLNLAAVDPSSLENLCTNIVTIVNAAVTGLVEAIFAFFDALAERAPAIVDDLKVIAEEFLRWVLEAATPFVAGVTLLISEFVAGLLVIVGVAGEELITIIFDLLGTLTTSFCDWILETMEYFAEKTPEFAEAGATIIIEFLDAMGTWIPEVIDAGWDMIIDLINGLTTSLEENGPEFKEAIDNFFATLLSTIVGLVTGWFPDIKGKGKELLENLKEGIAAKASSIYSKITTVISTAVSKVKDTLESWKQAGRDAIQGFIDGIGELAENVWNKVKSIFNGAVNSAKDTLDENSPSKIFKEMGIFVDEGFILGVEKGADAVADATGSMAQGAVDTMSDAMGDVYDLFQSDMDSAPTIRPIVDLTDFDNGMNALNSRLGDRSIDVSGTATYARTAMYSDRDNSSTNQNAQLKGAGDSFSFTINVNGAEGQDVEELADAVARRINYEIDSRKAVFS